MHVFIFIFGVQNRIRVILKFQHVILPQETLQKNLQNEVTEFLKKKVILIIFL